MGKRHSERPGQSGKGRILVRLSLEGKLYAHAHTHTHLDLKAILSFLFSSYG